MKVFITTAFFAGVFAVIDEINWQQKDHIDPKDSLEFCTSAATVNLKELSLAGLFDKNEKIVPVISIEVVPGNQSPKPQEKVVKEPPVEVPEEYYPEDGNYHTEDEENEKEESLSDEFYATNDYDSTESLLDPTESLFAHGKYAAKISKPSPQAFQQEEELFKRDDVKGNSFKCYKVSFDLEKFQQELAQPVSFFLKTKKDRSLKTREFQLAPRESHKAQPKPSIDQQLCSNKTIEECKVFIGASILGLNDDSKAKVKALLDSSKNQVKDQNHPVVQETKSPAQIATVTLKNETSTSSSPSDKPAPKTPSKESKAPAQSPESHKPKTKSRGWFGRRHRSVSW